MKIHGIIMGMVAIIVLIIAIENDRASGKPASVTTTYQQTLQRFHDDENGVTCWGREGYGHTLSCLPDWMLTHQKVKP